VIYRVSACKYLALLSPLPLHVLMGGQAFSVKAAARPLPLIVVEQQQLWHKARPLAEWRMQMLLFFYLRPNTNLGS
jgi:hypothetical protein